MGWFYLAAVKDLATMEIVGPLPATATLEKGGVIHHSDRGVQHACGDRRKLLALHAITASMSRKGN